MNTPYYDRHGVSVHAGDCLDVLRAMPGASVDSVVTDPPYGLADIRDTDAIEALTAWCSGNREHIPTRLTHGFMGRDWDRFVPPPAVFDECLRVLKPGGHLLCFAGTRTVDLMGLSIRLAGFEIRDSITWLYGGGMPKGSDISKAIDRRRDDSEEARVVGAWLGEQRRRAGFTHAAVCGAGGWHGAVNHGGASVNWEKGLGVPTWEQWERLRELLGFGDDMDAEVWRLNGRKGTPGEAWGRREVVAHGYRVRRTSTVDIAGRSDGQYDITAPATLAAARWQGWNTALRPASEPILVARKPLAGTVTETVLAHGTGALNIAATKDAAGRWPANVVLDECAVKAVDEQPAIDHASRFFCTAKAAADERPVVDGVGHPTVKPLSLMRWLTRLVTPPAGTVLDPFAGSGTTLHAARAEGFRAIGVEREPAYLPLIRARLDARPGIAATAAVAVDDHEPLGLFDLLDEEAS